MTNLQNSECNPCSQRFHDQQNFSFSFIEMNTTTLMSSSTSTTTKVIGIDKYRLMNSEQISFIGPMCGRLE